MKWTDLAKLSFPLWTASCAGSEYPETYYAPSEYQSASSEYERNVSAKGVYEGVYENQAAIRHYCGTGEGVADMPTWLAACDRHLERVYWARVRTQYKFADLKEVVEYCDFKPNECATPKGLDAAIRSSHISGSQRRNYQQAQQIEADRAARARAASEAFERATRAFSCAMAAGAGVMRAECLAERVVRCKGQLRAIGANSSYEELCIESYQAPGSP